jgi:alpha-N-arabinofuranosidase
MNNADRVKMACIAQLVNAIGAIRTEPGGPAWRQTIFHPFALAARHAKGDVLQPVIDAPVRPGKLHPEMKVLVASATHCADDGRVAIFALNRALDDEQDFTVAFRAFAAPLTLVESVELHHADLQACNTRLAPHEVVPRAHGRARVEDGTLRATLRPASWNVFVVGTGARGTATFV